MDPAQIPLCPRTWNVTDTDGIILIKGDYVKRCLTSRNQSRKQLTEHSFGAVLTHEKLKRNESTPNYDTENWSVEMNKREVMALLQHHKNERGIANWQRLGAPGNLKNLGIGLTQLRKIAKAIGRDHVLARKLWASDVYEAKVMSLLIDDPKKITREQAEQQVEEVEVAMLAHVFASCDATLAKTPFVADLAVDWIARGDAIRRECGYSLLYELSKSKKQGLADDFFMHYIQLIEQDLVGEENWVKSAMSAALMGIGKRNSALNKAALRAARAIGPIEVDYGDDNDCQPIDVIKHLTSDYLKRKFAKMK